jgi:hypothetical protein
METLLFMQNDDSLTRSREIPACHSQVRSILYYPLVEESSLKTNTWVSMYGSKTNDAQYDCQYTHNPIGRISISTMHNTQVDVVDWIRRQPCSLKIISKAGFETFDQS